MQVHRERMHIELDQSCWVSETYNRPTRPASMCARMQLAQQTFWNHDSDPGHNSG